MTSEQVITEARAYADRIAKVHADHPDDRDEFSKLAFIAYLQGFKAGIDWDSAKVKEVFRHD